MLYSRPEPLLEIDRVASCIAAQRQQQQSFSGAATRCKLPTCTAKIVSLQIFLLQARAVVVRGRRSSKAAVSLPELTSQQQQCNSK